MPAWLLALALAAWPAAAWAAGAALSPREVNSVRAVVATLGFAWLGWRVALGAPESWAPRVRRIWGGGLLVLGALGGACGFSLFQFGPAGFGHPSETFHYFMGPKYFRELGYTRLYRCTAVAEAEVLGSARVAARYARDLETNRVGPAAALLEPPEDCTRHFAPERWQSFKQDIEWFRNRPTPHAWLLMQTDHGYNGTPVWGLFGGWLANSGPAGDGRMLALQLLDPLLLLGAWVLVGVSFGWQTLCVALLFWGTHYPSQYDWTGGSILRQLELAAVLAAVCCLRRERPATAGALLAGAVLVRIYPVLLLSGLALQVLLAPLAARRPRLSTAQRRLLLGGSLAGALLLALSLLSAGAGAWTAFAENSRLLLDTPLRNHMGLRTVLSYDPAARAQRVVDGSLEDPYAPWKQARQRSFAQRRALFWTLVAGFVALLAVAVRSQPDWVALILGAGLVPIAAELTCYYSAILVVFALLWGRTPPVAAALCGLSALGWLLVERFHFLDEIFTWISLATALFVVFATVWVWRTQPVSRPLERPPHPGGS